MRSADPDALTLPFTPEVERQLLDRIFTVQEWMSVFARALGKRMVPQLKTWISGHIYYAPISNVIKVPCTHLLTLDDQDLRLAIAHEMGHFSRRWPSLFAWTLENRLDEEKYADRCSITLTGATVDEWAHSIVSVAKIEEPGYQVGLDIVFQARQKVLQQWADKRRVG